MDLHRLAFEYEMYNFHQRRRYLYSALPSSAGLSGVRRFQESRENIQVYLMKVLEHRTEDLPEGSASRLSKCQFGAA